MITQKPCLIIAFLLLGMLFGFSTSNMPETKAKTATITPQTEQHTGTQKPLAESQNLSISKKPLPKTPKVGVLIISHGSRSVGWRKMVSEIGENIQEELLQNGRIQGLRSAFMEYSEPSIATQLKAFDSEGYTDLILVPLLLTVSSHSFDDIPTICGQKQGYKTTETLKVEGIEIYRPRATVHIAPLLDYPTILMENVVRRARGMIQEPENEGIVLVAYGSKPYEKAWLKLIEKVRRDAMKKTKIDCIEHAWCGHLVHYQSEPTEKAIQAVLEQKERALVIPILVAVDEMFQGKIIGGAIQNVKKPDRIVYRHDAILPDANINRWVVDISRKMAAKLNPPSTTSDAKTKQ